MMKKTVVCIALLGLLAMGGQAFAAICSVDDVPAATLLLPYFQVDLDNPNGQTTLFSVNNASATATLAHVTIWSDWSVPVLDFDIYLTGYDVQTINLRDILVDGNLPITASAGQDPSDTISPKGLFSQDINFASCQGILPFTNPQLTSDFVAHLQEWLTGQQSHLLGTCAADDHGDNVMRGYVTVDVSNACSRDFPTAAGYFVKGGSGIAADRNQLWGDYFYVDADNNFAQGETLVHIEADAASFAPGDYTFYGRYVAASSADDREPLATTFASRYVNGGLFTGGTNLVVWRDTAEAAFSAVTCGTAPDWWPLGQTQIVIFDEQEQPNVPDTAPVSGIPGNPGIIPFPDETNNVAVGGPDLPVPFNFGWIYLNLNQTSPGSLYAPFSQNWVTTVMSAEGRFSVGFDAIQLDSACAPNTIVIGNA